MKELKRIAEELRAIDEHDMTDGEYIDALADAVGTSDANDLLRETLAELIEPQLPEGIEWPRFEDGELVGIGDEVDGDGETMTVKGVALYVQGWNMTLEASDTVAVLSGENGERVKRPNSQVLDADGVPIEVGDVVYCDGGDEATTASFFRVDNAGQTQITVKDSGGAYYTLSPSRLSHTRPDSWERLEKDATVNPEAYCRANGCELPPNPDRADYADAFASDLVRRAKALAKAVIE